MNYGASFASRMIGGLVVAAALAGSMAFGEEQPLTSRGYQIPYQAMLNAPWFKPVVQQPLYPVIPLSVGAAGGRDVDHSAIAMTANQGSPRWDQGSTAPYGARR